MLTILRSCLNHHPLRQRLPRLGATLAVLALAMAGFVQSAAAYVPGGDLISAINSRNSAIRSSNYSLWLGAFSTASAGPDGIAGADGTPDGRGAFVFYSGNNGKGAIYAFRDGAVEAHGIYGAILVSWSAGGYENGYGYPTSEEINAGSNELRWGCQSGDRAQWFWSFARNKPYLACFHWANGVTSWKVPVAF